MKSRYKVLYAIVILSFLIVGIFFSFLPDQIPMHYNLACEVNRFGSKYENILYPLIVMLMAVFFVALVLPLQLSCFPAERNCRVMERFG